MPIALNLPERLKECSAQGSVLCVEDFLYQENREEKVSTQAVCSR